MSIISRRRSLSLTTQQTGLLHRLVPQHPSIDVSSYRHQNVLELKESRTQRRPGEDDELSGFVSADDPIPPCFSASVCSWEQKVRT